MYVRKHKEQLSLFTCQGCGKQLNATEHFSGTICASCRNPVQYQQAEAIKEPDKVILQQLAQWDNSDKIKLDDFPVNYMGKMFRVEVHTDKTLTPRATIFDGTTIIFADSNGTTEGIDVFDYCKLMDNNLLKRNVK